jgi:hypothetical protein
MESTSCFAISPRRARRCGGSAPMGPANRSGYSTSPRMIWGQTPFHQTAGHSYTQDHSGGTGEIWTLPLDLSNPDRPKPGTPGLFFHSPFYEARPGFSPDGRWVAYVSNESGRAGGVRSTFSRQCFESK